MLAHAPAFFFSALTRHGQAPGLAGAADAPAFERRTPEPAPATPDPGTGPSPHYWPCEQLNAFILQMAAQGHCVNAAMMLGDRTYAFEQLARARRSGVPDLIRLAAELQTFFDEREGPRDRGWSAV